MGYIPNTLSDGSKAWNRDYTEFTMGRVLISHTLFNMLDLLEIRWQCW